MESSNFISVEPKGSITAQTAGREDNQAFPQATHVETDRRFYHSKCGSVNAHVNTGHAADVQSTSKSMWGQISDLNLTYIFPSAGTSHGVGSVRNKELVNSPAAKAERNDCPATETTAACQQVPVSCLERETRALEQDKSERADWLDWKAVLANSMPETSSSPVYFSSPHFEELQKPEKSEAAQTNWKRKNNSEEACCLRQERRKQISASCCETPHEKLCQAHQQHHAASMETFGKTFEKYFLVNCEMGQQTFEGCYSGCKEKTEWECQQHYAANKERIKQPCQEHYAANKEKEKKGYHQYYAANKEKIKRARREYYAANKEKVKQARRQYYVANREKVLQARQECYAASKETSKQTPSYKTQGHLTRQLYYAANKDRVKQAQREYYAANKEKIKLSRQQRYLANREKEKNAQRQRYLANREKRKQVRQKHYAVNREKEKQARREYYTANREKELKAGRQRYAAKTKRMKQQQCTLSMAVGNTEKSHGVTH